MKIYLLRHLQVLFDTLGRMLRSPLPSAMAIMVLSIAITLPLLLFKIAESIEGVGQRWDGGRPQISLFLSSVSEGTNERALAFGEALLNLEEISEVEYISPIEALVEFKRTSGFESILDNLPENPLPGLLLVFPHERLSDQKLAQLVANLSERPEVDTVSFDRTWVQRLSALVGLFKQILYVLAVLMGMGIVLIISNSAHLEILSRKDEIEVVDQIGGTHAFIRRPFLYFGMLHGALGAFMSLIITSVSLWVISYPANTLASLYDTDFEIKWIGLLLSLVVVVVAGLLGWLAARVTVGSYLKRLKISAHGR